MTLKQTYQCHAQVFATYKPVGDSTYDRIRAFKQHCKKNNLRYDKIGHFGTLDPFAKGLVLIGVNGACRLNEIVQKNLTKTYQAVGVWGTRMDSMDVTGTIQQEDPNWLNKIPTLNINELNEIICKKFLGTIQQLPPSFSALKHEGKALYEYARAGTFIQKEARDAHIYDLKIDAISINEKTLTFTVTVSSGTYIRVLFEDIAQSFGTLGYLKELTRTQIGCVGPIGPLGLEFENIPLNQLVPLPIIDVNVEQKASFFQGQQTLLTQLTDIDDDRIKSQVFIAYDKTILGVAQIINKHMHPKIVFKTP